MSLPCSLLSALVEVQQSFVLSDPSLPGACVLVCLPVTPVG